MFSICMRTWFSSTGSRKSQEKSFGNKVLCAKRFARQRWRAWIETISTQGGACTKHWFARQRWRAWIETCRIRCRCLRPPRFARQRWRAWIETPAPASPGLPPRGFARQRWRAWIETYQSGCVPSGVPWFARQRWRAWIETMPHWIATRQLPGSPVSDGGRGLKLLVTPQLGPLCLGSPVSDGGRGLKQSAASARAGLPTVRPSAMAGVD